MLAISAVTKSDTAGHTPDHHVVPANTTQAASGWTSYLPSWVPSPERSRPSLSKDRPAGFRNPWPSWHKPTLAQLWDSFQWGEDDDACIELASSHLANDPAPPKPDPSTRPRFGDINRWPDSPGAKAARLLRIENPDFSFPPASDPDARAKVTWLGHAAVLVQLAPLESHHGRPVRCLFDPMFSMRSSPSQYAGPVRSYPPPCRVEDLPPIDAVFISHNHFDHMDYDSIMAIWRHSRDTVRFFVPLENKQWLLDWGISTDRVTEMDWWDSAVLTQPTASRSGTVRVWCTPAQHNSWRPGADADSALWSSWYLEHRAPAHSAPFRVFSAGDTGYQFHASPSWPPSPGREDEEHFEEGDEYGFPPCPAFAEIRDRIGPPSLLLLPVSVGATFAYLRSFSPLPNWINPFPRHSPGVTAANHMPPWDAVRVLKIMAGGKPAGEGRDRGEGVEAAPAAAAPAVAVAMHWGTFVTDPVEVLKTLGQLEWACQRQGVRFARALPESEGNGASSVDGLEHGVRSGPAEPWFVPLNHGQSICL